MTFKFRLQRLLELREQAEQAKARALAEARHTAEHATAVRDTIADAHAAARAEAGVGPERSALVGHLQQVGTVVEALDQRLQQADAVVEQAEQVVADAQRQLHDATRDRRVMDRLKTRHTDAWRVELAQQDRVTMDEIALARHGRRAEQARTEAAADRAATTTSTDSAS